MIIKTLLGLATTLTDMDDTMRAIGVYKRVLLIIEKNKGPTDESLALPLSHLGHCLLEEGRVDEAELAMLRYGFFIRLRSHMPLVNFEMLTRNFTINTDPNN